MKITASVIQGVQIGAKFGIATANLLLDELPEIEEGVHLVRVEVKDDLCNGVLHFGPRKTFGGDFSAEVHILDFKKDIYGQKITIELVKKLRDVQAFKNADALFTQIETDILVARKYFLRQEVRTLWKSQSLSDQEHLAEIALRHLSSAASFLEAKKVFCYAPQLGKEITFVAGMMKTFPDKKYFFPRTEGSQIQFYPVDNYSSLMVGEYGILEPEQSTSILPEDSGIMLVPSMAMDKDRNRLGQGGGFYDKYLSALKVSVRTLGVIPRFALVEKVPTEKHDKVIDEMIVCEL